ncbi:MAG TPA: hypothetical protein VM940_09065 [Chthoniobacterales bacterium]|jgi:hypothetical protein|nr:hypothetical protein [Chthoniobacterales bacterium]
MRLARHARSRGEGGVALWIIVAALLGGAAWFLYSARRDAENNTRAFAREVVQRVVVNYDDKYLNYHLTPEALAKYQPGYRERMLQYLRGFGPVTQPVPITGDVSFNSYFFDPVGIFKAVLVYPTMTATLELTITRGMTRWQVNDIDLRWNPPAAPTPTPSPVLAAPTPTPSPTPEQKAPRRKRR